MFNSFVTGSQDVSENNKNEKKEAQQSEKKIVIYNYPKSEPNLQSAFVFPWGDSGSRKPSEQ